MPKTKTLLGVTYTNSEMPDSVLIKTYGVQLFKAAAESLFRVEEAALKEGFSFKISSGYRTAGFKGDLIRYERGELKKKSQWALWEGWNNGINGVIEDIENNLKILVGPQKFNLAADPNKGSNHGFGIAIDIYGNNIKSTTIVSTWVRKNPNKIGDKESFINYKGLTTSLDEKGNPLSEKQDAFQEWFNINGSFYGWTWEGKKFNPIEPWHFEYNPDIDKYIKESDPIPTKTPEQINYTTRNNQIKTNKYNLTTRLTDVCVRNPSE